MLAYCTKDSTWTFAFNDDESFDPCDYKELLAKSSETKAFDVMEVASETWFSKEDVPLEYIEFLCNGVAVDRCETIEQTQTDGIWCPALNVPTVDNIDGFVGGTATDFEAQKGLDAHKHPIYWGRPLGDESTLNLILFTGRRWVLTDTNKLNISATDIGNMFQSGNFHASDLPKEAVTFLSDAVDSATDTCSPLGLAWHHAKYSEVEDVGIRNSKLFFPSPDLTRPVDTRLSCSKCNNQTNPCLFEGVCQSDGRCACKNGATGSFCDIAPLNNGQCDQYFNNQAFEFDGGDCCGGTCAYPICGVGWLDYAFGTNLTLRGSGFPNCLGYDMVKLKIYVQTSHPWEASLQLECDGVKYINIPFGTQIEHGNNQTLYVKDGVDCSFTMKHTLIRGPNNTTMRLIQESEGTDVLIFEKQAQATHDGDHNWYWPIIEETFSIVASCLLNDIFAATVTPDNLNEAQLSALSWLNGSPQIERFGCGGLLLIERYALAVLNYATGNALQQVKDWLLTEIYCDLWEGLFCDENAHVVQLDLCKFFYSFCILTASTC